MYLRRASYLACLTELKIGFVVSFFLAIKIRHLAARESRMKKCMLSKRFASSIGFEQLSNLVSSPFAKAVLKFIKKELGSEEKGMTADKEQACS